MAALFRLGAVGTPSVQDTRHLPSQGSFITNQFFTNRSPQEILEKVKTYYDIPEMNRPSNSTIKNVNNWSVTYVRNNSVKITIGANKIYGETRIKVEGRSVNHGTNADTRTAVNTIISDLKGYLGIQGGRRKQRKHSTHRKRSHRRAKSRRSRT